MSNKWDVRHGLEEEAEEAHLSSLLVIPSNVKTYIMHVYVYSIYYVIHGMTVQYK